MAVKASGYFLEDVSEAAGFAVLDLSGSNPSSGSPKPSMEAPLHTLLGSYVIHTHPVAVAALVCSEEGPVGFTALFPDKGHYWIDYVPPGEKLFQEVKRRLGPAAHDAGEKVLFLQNHGLFVSAPSSARCMEIHDAVVLKLEKFFNVPESKEKLPQGKFLTPDHAVYGRLPEGPLSGKQKTSVEETQIFAQKVYGLILAKKWRPRWLSDQDVATVLGMDEEKYRQQLWAKP